MRWTVLLCVAACSLPAACKDGPGPNPPPAPGQPQCTVTPPATTESSRANEQAAKLNATIAGAPASGGVEYSDKAVFQAKATYAALSDKNAACSMLFQTMQCIDQRSPASPLAMKLADYVNPLCAGSGAPNPPTPGTATSTAPSTPPLVATDVAKSAVACDISCGGDSRLHLNSASTYQMTMFAKNTNNAKSFTVHQDGPRLFDVLAQPLGASFTLRGGGAPVKICTTLNGSGGGCDCYCSVDAVKHTARVSTNELSVDFSVSCTQ